MPPHAVADVAVLAVDSPHEAELLLGELPQAATVKIATTARPRWRVSLPNFILRSPPRKPCRRACDQVDRRNHGSPPPTLQGQSSGVRLISVRGRLIPSEDQVSARFPRKPRRRERS